jgi:F0F1-type ATP synthase assembly protein I
MALGDLSTLEKHYQLELNRKETLENKANNMTTVAGVVAALLVGFRQFLIEKLAALTYNGLSYIIPILLIGILASVASIVLSVLAFRVQNYYYVIGHTAVDKPSLRGRLALNDRVTNALKLKSGVGDEDAEIEAYKECIKKNSELNDSKAKIIEGSLWAFVISIGFIAILFVWLLVARISVPSS